MQTSYSRTQTVAFAGMKQDVGFGYVESMAAEEQIGFGLALMKNVGESKRCRLPNANVCTITDDAGTYTAGNYVVVINGLTVTVAYDTNKDTTLTAVATALQALNMVSTAVYSNTAHTIIITAANNVNLNVVPDITGITGNMTISSTVHTCTETFHGISLATNSMEQVGGQIVYDKATITLSGDALTTSDTIQVTLNGVTLDAITYATSEAATLGVLCDQLQAQNGIYSATLSSRTITLLAHEGLPLTVNSVVIVDNALASVAPSAAIVRLSQNTRGVGNVFYRAADQVSILRRGRVYVTVEDAVTADSLVYFRHKDSGTNLRGAFRGSASTGYCTLLSGARFTMAAAAGGISAIEINLP